MKQAVLLIKLESVTLNTDCACTRRVPTTGLTGLSPRLELFPTVQVRQSITQPSQIKVVCYLLYLAVLICQGCAYWRGQGLLRFRNGEFWTLCVRAFMFFFWRVGDTNWLELSCVLSSVFFYFYLLFRVGFYQHDLSGTSRALLSLTFFFSTRFAILTVNILEEFLYWFKYVWAQYSVLH